MKKLSTHRLLQLSQLRESLHALASQSSRAACNAVSIKNRTMAIRFSSQAMRCRSLAEYIGHRLHA